MSKAITVGDLIVVLFVGAVLWVLANIALDSYREHRVVEVVASLTSSPGVLNAEGASLSAQTEGLCEAKGYTPKQCAEILR